MLDIPKTPRTAKRLIVADTSPVNYLVDEHYKLALDQAKEELSSLFRDRERIDGRIGKVQNTIKVLLCESEADADYDIPLPFDTEEEVSLGMTNAIREVFKKSSGAMTPTQIRNGLDAMRFDLTKYKQMMVPIHNTLKRLEDNVEITGVKNAYGKVIAYKWIDEATKKLVLSSPAGSFPMGHPLAYISQRLREKK